MAKQEAQHAKKLAAHVKKLVARYKPEEPPTTDPVVQLVLGMLNWNTTTRAAEDAYDALMERMVDVNELRISPIEEIHEIIGRGHPDVHERLMRLKEVLHEVYVREYAVSMDSIAAKSKKEQRQYLDTLPGIPPYVAAQVMLLSFNGHAMPVDDKLAALLVREGCLPEGLTPAEAEAWLSRQIKAADALKAYLALQSWADVCKMPPGARGETAPDPSVIPDEAPKRKKKNARKKPSRSRKKIAKKK